MKTRKILQNVLAVLSALAGVVLLVGAISVTIGISNPDKAQGILANTVTSLQQVTQNITFVAEWFSTAILLGVPALLCAIGCVFLFGKSDKPSVKVTAEILCVVGVLIPTVLTVVLAQQIFGDNATLARLITLVIFAIFVAIAVLALLAQDIKPKGQSRVLIKTKSRQRKRTLDKELQRQASLQYGIEKDVPQVQFEQQFNVFAENARKQLEEQRQQAEQQQAEQNEKQAKQQQELRQREEQNERQNKMQQELRQRLEQESSLRKPSTPATMYVPDNEISVQKVMDETYNKPTEELDSTTLGKIKRVREFYDQNVINKDEYIGLVNKYLGK